MNCLTGSLHLGHKERIRFRVGKEDAPQADPPAHAAASADTAWVFGRYPPSAWKTPVIALPTYRPSSPAPPPRAGWCHRFRIDPTQAQKEFVTTWPDVGEHRIDDDVTERVFKNPHDCGGAVTETEGPTRQLV